MISITSITMGPRQVGTAGPGIQPGTLSLSGFTRDRVIFDSGAGFGRAIADVPLSGTATVATIIEGRAVSLDDGGATTTAWADVASADAGGNWNGSIAVPRGPSWFRPEVRLKSQPGVTATGALRFGVGHVIAFWGQSELDRITSSFYDNTLPPPIADAEAVQVFHGATSAPQITQVSDAQPLTAAVAAMAATLIAERPGEKFALIFHAVPGTDPRGLVNDADPSRLWSADKALHDFATADGQNVGLAAMSWFASPGSLGTSYGEALFPLFTAKRMDGTPVIFPAAISYGAANSYLADHWFGELYDYGQTKWVPYGPHRFEIDGDMLDATHYPGGAQQFNLINKEAARQSWRAMLALPDATMFLPAGLEPTTYVNGLDDGAGGWTDLAHPAGDTSDGTQALARLTAIAVLQSAGLTSQPVPDFDQCIWDPSGNWAEVWSSSGAITTTRIARGEPPLPATFAHWTEVVGFQINGQPAHNNQILAGRVRIFPNTGSFVSSDVIQFGEGGATGALKFPEDSIVGLWKNLPIVDTGTSGLNGIPLRPLANPDILANTLPAGAPSFVTTAAGPYFLDPANLGAGVTGITFSARLMFPAYPVTTEMLFSQANLGFDVELMNTGNLRVNIKDGAGLKVLGPTVISTALTAGVWYDVICSADQVAMVFRLTINGVSVPSLAFTTPGNGEFQSNRALSFLRRGANALQFSGHVEYLRIWKSADVAGAEPAAAPFKVISGPAAVVNTDPWKLGADAT